MAKQLEGLQCAYAWMSHLGSLKGCLDYLGADVSMPWLAGGTGVAFVLNIHEVVCPSGPTAWNWWPMIGELGSNVGYQLEGISSWKGNDPDFAGSQRRAYDFVRSAIDRGRPCYGWELAGPEYYVINGYDNDGYLYSDFLKERRTAAKPWRELGDTEIGMLEVHSVRPLPPVDDAQTVRASLTAALRFASNTPDMVMVNDGYRAGLKGYETWADALKRGTASRFGQGYNGAVWAECRQNAVAFLREAKERLGERASGPISEAIGHYSEVRDLLVELSELYPFEMGEDDERLRCLHAAGLVRRIRDAEEQGMAALEDIVTALDG